MTTETAQSAVVLSALTVAGIYEYRKLTEVSLSSKTVASGAHFVIGFGFTYVVLSLIAQFAPDLGGMLAILVAVGDLMANGLSVFKDVSTALTATGKAAK